MTDGSTAVAGGPAGGSDSAQRRLDLLRAYEPVVRFTRGELFFPTAVEPYVECCSLWSAGGSGETRCEIEAGQLTLQRLCDEAARRPAESMSMRFVARPLDRAGYRRWRREHRDRLQRTVRFTTTGMFGRVIEAGFRASLLLRGKVAAGVAAAAEISYRERLAPAGFIYYGRVVASGGYLCLQYWFFYAMNDWRSTFGGVNDHEADWEMATVYLEQPSAGPPRPAWVAYSSHDHTGGDLRRRWDDPDLLRLGDHPVLHPGAGSHSGAFLPGDYVISVDPPNLRAAIGLARRAQRLLAPWRDQTRPSAGFGIPFVDYARGNGTVIGSGQPAHWTARLIDDDTAWVRDYRGLWGLDTEDHFGGERAPSGPRYERDGSVRQAWADPLGWAGLSAVPPDGEQFATLLGERIAALQRTLEGLDEEITARRARLRELAVELRSLAAHDHARSRADARRVQLRELELALDQTITERTALADELRTHRDTLERPLALEDPQAHVATPTRPRGADQLRRTRFLALWAAVSTPLLIATIPVMLLARPAAWITMICVLAFMFAGAEAFARRRLLSFIASTALLLFAIAVIGAVVELSLRHWRIGVAAVFVVAAIALLIGNIGDLRHGWRRGGTMTDAGEDERPTEVGTHEPAEPAAWRG